MRQGFCVAAARLLLHQNRYERQTHFFSCQPKKQPYFAVELCGCRASHRSKMQRAFNIASFDLH